MHHHFHAINSAVPRLSLRTDALDNVRNDFFPILSVDIRFAVRRTRYTYSSSSVDQRSTDLGEDVTVILGRNHQSVNSAHRTLVLAVREEIIPSAEIFDTLKNSISEG